VSKEFTNEDRSRYYGLRVGDTVQLIFNGGVWKEGKVVEYGVMDNNAVYVQTGNEEPQKCVAEWCKIIKRVEDDPQ
jgi:hypothetical protein